MAAYPRNDDNTSATFFGATSLGVRDSVGFYTRGVPERLRRTNTTTETTVDALAPPTASLTFHATESAARSPEPTVATSTGVYGYDTEWDEEHEARAEWIEDRVGLRNTTSRQAASRSAMSSTRNFGSAKGQQLKPCDLPESVLRKYDECELKYGDRRPEARTAPVVTRTMMATRSEKAIEVADGLWNRPPSLDELADTGHYSNQDYSYVKAHPSKPLRTPSQQFRIPLTENQKVGWDIYDRPAAIYEGDKRYPALSSEESRYHDAVRSTALTLCDR